MERKRITCPVTAHIEELDVERTSCGIVIGGCSRFAPRDAIECERECARRMDRRDRRNIDDRDERVLVVFEGSDGRSRSIADLLAEMLTDDGLIVELGDADTRTVPPPGDYEVVVIGSALRFGRHRRGVIDYVVRHRDALRAMPAFLFSVTPRLDGGAQGLARLIRQAGWQPTGHITFAGDHTPHGALWRWLARCRDAAQLTYSQGSHRLADRARVRELALRIADEAPAVTAPA